MNNQIQISTQEFLEAFFSGFFQKNKGFIEIRLIKIGENRTCQFFRNKIQDVIKDQNLYESKENQGYNIYFSPNPRDRMKGKEENVKYITSLYIDLDAKDFGNDKNKALSQLEKMPDVLQPSIIIDSGNGYHCYWLLEEPISVNDTAKLKGYLWGLSSYLGGDPQCKDLSRVLRLPNTYKIKILIIKYP